ncbi:MAG: heavy-metal-associated domain-containing protein [Gammaproteobacteria bacterium]|nr:heavy-metal-associated domain-containing protein [Gammaproteobacteria bacterium]
MGETTLKITGMNCEHCMNTVTRALQGVAGVEKAEVSLKPGGAVVYGDARVEALIAAVTEKGYQCAAG